MLFTKDSIDQIQPRSCSFFLVEQDSKGFAVKALKTSRIRFYYRKKVQGRRVDIPLGENLEVALACYGAVVVKEQRLKQQHKEALSFATGAVYFGPIPKAQSPIDSQIQNPFFYPNIDFGMLSKRFIAEHVERNLRPSTAKNYIFYLKKVEAELNGSELMHERLLKLYIPLIDGHAYTQFNNLVS